MPEQGTLFEVHVPAQLGESIYVIGEAGSSVVKIGKATDVKSRLSSIQTSSPMRLVVRWRTPGGRPLERQLHERFDKIRLEGEWFDFGNLDPVTEVRAAVEKITGQPGLDPDRVLPNGDVQWGQLDFNGPAQSDPDHGNPFYQRMSCGCRRLSPTEHAERGFAPDAFAMLHGGVPDEGVPWCFDNH